jgi:hypothetical protein
MRAWEGATHSAQYVRRYGHLYNELDTLAPKWASQLKREGGTLFPPSIGLIQAAERTVASSPTAVFKVLDAAGTGTPDPAKLKQAIADDAARLTRFGPDASELKREFAASLHMEEAVGGQILQASQAPTSFLLKALSATDEVEGYLHAFEALPPGADAPLPPPTFRLLVYIATANAHDPSDGAHVPISKEQSQAAQALVDQLLESVLGRQAAEKFPGHSKTLAGAGTQAPEQYLRLASVKQAGTDSVAWR